MWLFTLNACLPVCFFLSLPRRSCSFRFYTRLCCSHCTSLCNRTRAGIPVTNQLRSGFSFHEIVFYIRSRFCSVPVQKPRVASDFLTSLHCNHNVPFTLPVQFFFLGRLLFFVIHFCFPFRYIENLAQCTFHVNVLAPVLPRRV